MAVALAALALQTVRLDGAQRAVEAAKQVQATQVAERRSVRAVRAKTALAAVAAGQAAGKAAEAPLEWQAAPVPQEVDDALRAFDGPAPDGVRD
jgi:hypothetical protein